MRTRNAAIGGAAIVLAAAILIGRACHRDGEHPGEATAPAPTAEASTAARRRPAPPAPSAAQSAAASAAPATATGFKATWGAALGQLGRNRPEEGNPEGPMSVASDRKGRILVLDQLNNRIVRYGEDGKPESSFGADLQTAQDVAAGDDGTVAAMDRFTEKAVTLYDESGKEVGKLELIGDGVSEPGDLTGVFVDGEDVYVERQHGSLVKIGDTAGNPAIPRSEIPGRPSRDGLSYLNAGIIDAAAGRAYVSTINRATGEHRWTRELRMESMILTIVLLDSDRSGIIYFGTLLQDAPGEEIIEITCLAPEDGQPIGTAMVPANTMPEETFRDLAVLDGGGVVYALRTETGVSYQIADCR